MEKWPVNELRVDPLTGLKSIIAAGRASRPGGGFTAEPAEPVDPEKDPFLEGHEDRTPPEVWALRPDGGAARHARAGSCARCRTSSRRSARTPRRPRRTPIPTSSPPRPPPACRR